MRLQWQIVGRGSSRHLLSPSPSANSPRHTFTAHDINGFPQSCFHFSKHGGVIVHFLNECDGLRGHFNFQSRLANWRTNRRALNDAISQRFQAHTAKNIAASATNKSDAPNNSSDVFICLRPRRCLA
ncbi:hypothetical protein [Caudoviricetes sp.]|nr:hypothetical protein [Caudoviricetes sp.]